MHAHSEYTAYLLTVELGYASTQLTDEKMPQSCGTGKRVSQKKGGRLG